MYSYVYTNEAGDLFIDDQFQALGRTGKDIVEPLPEEMIPMPEGATFVLIPDRKPVVMKFDSFIPYPYPENKPVGAILPQGYTRTLMPAFLEPEEGDQILPLFGMGLNIGLDENITGNIFNLGKTAFLISAASVLGSVLVAWYFGKWIYGEKK
jgi:hypothetical protein